MKMNIFETKKLNKEGNTFWQMKEYGVFKEVL